MIDAPPDRGTSLAGVRGLAALVVVGLTLRTQLTVVGPVLPRIQQDIDVAHAAAGLLTGLVLVCMGLAAFWTPRALARFGAATTVGLALLVVGLAGIVRAVAPEALSILGATLAIGLGIGLGGASVPVFVKQRFGRRPAGATGTHVMAIILGSAVAASTAVPLAQAFGSWRWPLALSSIVTLLAALGWYALVAAAPPSTGETAGRPRSRSGSLPVGDPLAWLLVAVFCLQSLLFFGLATWLPAAYVELGWSEAEAANLVALLIVTGLPASLGVGWLADRAGSRRLYLVLSSALTLGCCVGFVALPELGLLWAAIVGLPLGALFALALTLPLDAAARPSDVGPLTGLMLGIGYLAAAAAPVAMGAARDVIGTFTASLTLLAVAAATLTGISLLLSETRFQDARAAGERTSPGGAGRLL